MAVIAKDNGYFFNSDGGDRLYDANCFDGVFNAFFTNGVTAGTMRVSQSIPASRNVRVSPGYANVNGKQAWFETESVLAIEAADGTYNRYDIVVIRRNDATRTISLDVVKGTPASNPVMPTPVREGGIYELVLARVFVNRGTTSIANANILNYHLDGNLCGTIGVANDFGSADQSGGYHNSIYRGKNLGTSYTEEQRNAIREGTFYDLFVGDYWYIRNRTYRIAAFDYYYDRNNLSTHHILIVPDYTLSSGPMNSTSTSTGAYLNSNFYTGNNNNTMRATAMSTIIDAWNSSYLLSHDEYMANATSNGAESNAVTVSSRVELMSEMMVYGLNIRRKYDSTSDSVLKAMSTGGQLPLFRHRPDLIRNQQDWWLRDVTSSTSFAMVASDGYEASQNASAYGIGCRPVFAIKG